MFLTNQIELQYGEIELLFNVPNNEQLTPIYLKSNELLAKGELTPLDFAAMGELVAPLLAGASENWATVPQITRDRLLFDVAKYILNESLSIPELKKK